MKFNLAHDGVDRGDLTNSCGFVSMMVAAYGTKGQGYSKMAVITPGLNVIEAKAVIMFVRGRVSIMFNS